MRGCGNVKKLMFFSEEKNIYIKKKKKLKNVLGFRVDDQTNILNAPFYNFIEQ